MKFYRKFGANIIVSETLVKLAGFISFGKDGAKKAKAVAFYPFICVKSEEYITLVFINHEKIHFRQQLETLFLGVFILNVVEDIYSMLFLKLQGQDRYLYRSSEQESYRNQLNLEYLENRSIFSLFKYIKDKKKLRFVENKPPEVVVGEKW